MKYIIIKEQIYNIINQYVDHYKIIELININQTYTNHLTFVVFHVKMVKIDFDSSKHNNELSKNLKNKCYQPP